MLFESFEYSLLTAALGMGLVFLFLGVLSALMVVIRTIFDRRRRSANTESGENVDRRDSIVVPDWAIAAAIVYLLQEESEVVPNAEGWVYARRTRVE